MQIDVYYSPPPGIPARLKELVDAAEKTIDLAIYHFTESTLAAALADAVARGVEVRAILDEKSAYETNSMCWELGRRGVKVWLDNAHSIMHCKYAIFDSRMITTGSANWSYNADGMAAEDMLLIEGEPLLIYTYENNWNYHQSHSYPIPRSSQ